MTAATYKEIITEGIEDLSADVLAEIADFVLFVRRKSLRPQEFAQEVHQVELQTELKKLSRASETHLEEEWKDYTATIAEIRARQNARHHQARTREEVDAALQNERESWSD